MTKTPEQLLEEIAQGLRKIDKRYEDAQSIAGIVERHEEALHLAFWAIGQLAKIIDSKQK